VSILQGIDLAASNDGVHTIVHINPGVSRNYWPSYSSYWWIWEFRQHLIL